MPDIKRKLPILQFSPQFDRSASIFQESLVTVGPVSMQMKVVAKVVVEMADSEAGLGIPKMQPMQTARTRCSSQAHL